MGLSFASAVVSLARITDEHGDARIKTGNQQVATTSTILRVSPE